MFNWKGFENREFCVDFENEADEMEFLKECEKREINWISGDKATKLPVIEFVNRFSISKEFKTLVHSNSELPIVTYTSHSIDCSIAENYIMERNRIRNENCGISNEIYGAELKGNSEKAIEIVQNWSDEHPAEKVVTYLDKLLEVFPNMPLKNDKVPRIICPLDLGLEEIGECGVNGMAPCARCWAQPYKENSNG